MTSNSDCCDAGDTDKVVHPGQAGWFTTAGPCGIQFDYDCDGTMAVQYPALGQCDLDDVQRGLRRGHGLRRDG